MRTVSIEEMPIEFQMEMRAKLLELHPVNMVLHCPRCHTQHIDEPHLIEKIFGCHHANPMTCSCDNRRWMNEPHRSHLCHNCGCIWRAADVPTNGVEAVTTHGKNDTTPIPEPVPNSVWYS